MQPESLITLVFVVLAIIYAARQALLEDKHDSGEPSGVDAGQGISPHPFVPVIDAGNTRVIDLRAAPSDELVKSSGLAWGLEARRALAPITLCVWVVAEPVLDQWMTADAIVWVILSGRMNEQRKQASPPAIDALYVPKGRYSDAQLSVARSSGLTLVHDVSVIGSEAEIDLAGLLALAPPAPQGRKRPEIGGTRHGLLSITDYVWETSDLLFVDLRRTSLAALDNLAIFAHVDKSLQGCPKAKPLTWVVAPWVLERWAGQRPAVLARWKKSVRAFGARSQQLALVGAGADPAFVAALRELGLKPVERMLHIRAGSHEFAVPLTEILQDLQMTFALPPKSG